MSNAAIDANSQQSMTARLNTDGTTVVRLKASPTLHALEISDGTTGSDNGGTSAATDENDRPTLFAVSSTDGKTLVALYADSVGELLINSN